jgi:1,4-alpha-glucan branching enzyme
MYFWSENFVLPLSHDEVVHGKRSLIERMPGDLWQRFANLRAMYGMMWAQPGKKLLFQGGEFGQYKEWAHDSSLDWNLLGETAFHTQLMAYVTALNQLYASVGALHERDVGIEGFDWVDANDADNSVYSFLRRGRGPKDILLAVFNCTPVPRYEYRIGVPAIEGTVGRWKELLNSDAEMFGGSGMGNMGGVQAERFPCHGREASVRLTLPPLSATYFVPEV